MELTNSQIKCLNYFKGKSVYIDFTGIISTLYAYDNFDWCFNGNDLEFSTLIDEQFTDIQLDKIIKIEIETDEPDDTFNAVEFYLNDMIIKLWTEE